MSTQTMIMITAVIAVIALILGAVALAKVNKKEGYAAQCDGCMSFAGGCYTIGQGVCEEGCVPDDITKTGGSCSSPLSTVNQ